MRYLLITVPFITMICFACQAAYAHCARSAFVSAVALVHRCVCQRERCAGESVLSSGTVIVLVCFLFSYFYIICITLT